MSKVIVAMSGGVDSSVSAALLKEQGYEVIGATMQVRSPDETVTDAIAAAERITKELNIPHHVIDLRDIFTQKVINYFCREYSGGRTPNPCVRCNQHIKFGALLDWARNSGADFMATGHYARIEAASGRYVLKKGGDSTKDQSYVLYTLTQDQLRHTLMPLGNLAKEEVREIAREMNLPVADKSESQEICFIPDNNYPGFLEEHVPQLAKSGPILDRAGNVLGEHRGIVHYTIGQRRGLGIPDKEPLYVTAIDSDRNAIIVGSKDEACGYELVVTDVNWITREEPSLPIAVKAKIRYRHREALAMVTPLENGSIHIKFEEPQMAITPGQAVVLYDRDIVIGGGTIERAGK